MTTITLTGSTSLATGTNYYLEYLSSIRDTDQDGYENRIDTYPVNVNVGNPRTGTGDTDADGIDDVCDPATPTPVAAADVDGDGFVNRDDDCTLVANAGQSESEPAATRADRGPVGDNIGDACDSEAGTRLFTQNGVAVTIAMSDSVANGRYMTMTNVVPKCVGATDADGDGYCAAQDSIDGGVCATPSPPSCTTRHTQWTGATFPALQMDTDGDKVSDALETYVGTDPVQSCSANSTNNNEPMDNLMFDLNDNMSVTAQDTGQYSAISSGGFGKNIVNGPFGVPARPGIRYDMNSDGILSGQDTAKFGGIGPYMGGVGPFGKTCATMGIPSFHQQ